MEPSREELLSALRDAEEFISVTLLNEPISAVAQRKRQELVGKLRSVTNRNSHEDSQEQEIYDDVREDENPSGSEELSTQVMTLDGPVPNESTEDTGPSESYEEMCTTENTEDFYDDTITEEQSKEEIYDDTIPEDKNACEDEGETYEVAESKKTSESGEAESEDYEGVEETKSVASLDTLEKSGTRELESLTKQIKPEDVEGTIMKGYLEKHRKKGIYIGRKWQRRYCVLRSFVLYYYMGSNSLSQKGSIILPGYTVAPHNPGKNNKEFILTRGKDRSFIFMAKSNEEAEKWMEAIRTAANTSKISKRQSEILEQLRLSGEGDEDTSSINEIANGNNSIEDFEETYDDVGQQEENTMKASPQPLRLSHPPPSSADLTLEDEELYDDVGLDMAPPPQPERSNPPVSEMQPSAKDGSELNGDVGVSPPPLPPQREQTLSQSTRPVSEVAPTTEEEEDFYDDVGVLPPTLPPQPQPERPTTKPTRPVSEIAPTTEEEEEFYDDVGVQGSEVQPTIPPVESKPPVPDRQLPPVPTNDSRPSPPRTPRLSDRIPLPPTPNEAPKPIIPPKIPPPQESKPPVVEKNNNITPTTPSEDKNLNKAPPPPPPEEETEEDQIDYSCIYQALWDCKPDADDELEFCRGDLLYIYEKPHSDWWIGSKYKPQGYETRLIPTNFIMQAYEM